MHFFPHAGQSAILWMGPPHYPHVRVTFGLVCPLSSVLEMAWALVGSVLMVLCSSASMWEALAFESSFVLPSASMSGSVFPDV